MPTLSSRLVSRSAAIGGGVETNLESGQIFVFTSGNETSDDGWFCWRSPGTGTARIEIWGAGGSGAQICCCGGGLPGNPGAYSLRTVSVNASSFICGCYGKSCGNSSSLCDRGTSQPTTICYSGTTAGCMCAQGGRGGISIFSDGTSLYCCFLANGFCGTLINTNCGVICNIGTATVIANCCCAQAYGGTTNCFGGFSCAGFFGCQPGCICQFQYFVTIPPGIFATTGAQITFGVENSSVKSNWSGMGPLEYQYVLGGAGTSPGMGTSYTTCWTGWRTCGCYEVHGCGVWYPYGTPGLPPHPCSSVRDHATRGGHGAVRITFI